MVLAAMEEAPSAILCVPAGSGTPIWANAHGRALGDLGDGGPTVDGRPVAQVVEEVLRTGHPVTLAGPLEPGGRTTTLVARPMRSAGSPVALVLLDAAGGDGGPVPAPVPDGVEQAQLSLLPPFLPLMPDLRLSGSYHRASSSASAGGDWYDAVPLGGGRLALVIGDAVGHGVPAAGAMSRLRGALRSTVLHDAHPGAVLQALHAFARQMDDVEGASVFYGVLDATTGRLDYSAAGHPAPFVVHADGRTSLLPVVPRPPLGSLPGTEAPVSQVLLDHGSTLVLFSNGAVTGSGPAPEPALDRLADVAREVLGRPGALDAEEAAELADAIAEGARQPEGWLDDVAVLVAHRRASRVEPLRLDLEAVPAALPGVRRRLGEWLAGLGMSEQDRVGVMVAVGEACANAAEHAYRGTDPGPMSVVAEVDIDGLLTVTVADRGTWRPPDHDPGDRGRGLLIMRQLVDTVLLQEEQGTTLTLRLRLRRSIEDDTERTALPAGAEVAVDRTGPLTVVRVTGVADEGTAEQLRIRLLEASRGATTPIELDVTDAGLFSSAAVREVLGFARVARDEGWRLRVRARAGGVTRHVLEISGLGDLVDLR